MEKDEFNKIRQATLWRLYDSSINFGMNVRTAYCKVNLDDKQINLLEKQIDILLNSISSIEEIVKEN